MDSSLIFDVGMNNGDDTAYYLHLGYRVVAIDADPKLIEHAEVRFAREIAEGRLTLVNVGIAATRSTMQFWVTVGNEVLSSFDQSRAARFGYSAVPIDIECRPFRDILDQYGVPYYLKIDIEGNDRLCIADLSPNDVPAYLSLEVDHGIEEFLTLEKLGFTRFKLVLQNPHRPVSPKPQPVSFKTKLDRWVRSKIDRNKTRWRRRLQRLGLIHDRKANESVPPAWKFPSGSSGAFGDQAVGHWLTADEAILALAKHRRHSDDLWLDIHARHESLANALSSKSQISRFERRAA